MKKWVIDGIEVEAGTGNVFADLGLPDAEKLKFKAGLMVEIVKAIREHPMVARGWRVIRAFVGRLKKWASLTRFALFRSVR